MNWLLYWIASLPWWVLLCFKIIGISLFILIAIVYSFRLGWKLGQKNKKKVV